MAAPDSSATPFDFESLSLTQIIRLRNQLSQVLKRRFEKPLALVFTDIVGSTPYFQKFGNEAGKALHQLHVDVVSDAIQPNGGRIVDTAGDGALTCFPTVDSAVKSVTTIMERVSCENMTRGRMHQLRLRIGLHWGRVLTDGTTVTGDAVNLAARIGDSGEAGEIRLSLEAFRESSNIHRVRCRPLQSAALKGVAEPVALYVLDWRTECTVPTSVLIKESGEEIKLPKQDLISFGRLRETEGRPANDVVLCLENKQFEKALSRWHFELRRKPEGYVLRTVSAQKTEVDGEPVSSGEEVPIGPGTIVRLSNVVTLEFRCSASAMARGEDATVVPPDVIGH